MRARCCLGSPSTEPSTCSLHVHTRTCAQRIRTAPSASTTGVGMGGGRKIAGICFKEAFVTGGDGGGRKPQVRGRTCERGALREQPSDHCRPKSPPTIHEQGE